MRKIILFLCVLFGFNILGMDFIARTRVEPSTFSQEKRNDLYRQNRDRFLRKLLRRYPKDIDRDEQVNISRRALEQKELIKNFEVVTSNNYEEN